MTTAKFAAALVAFAVLALGGRALADGLVDEHVRAKMLEHKDGRVARIQSEYHDVFVEKRGPMLALTTWARNETYFHSIVDLRDPDALPVPYTRLMLPALLYPQTIRRILMVGLGAGSISTYLGRAMPDVRIDAVELDPGVIAAGRKYFGLQETDKVRFIESDGRVYLARSKDKYDLIILDAFRELGVPFHLLTREFYTLVKDRLAPGGAVASNVAANTKLYVSTLATLRAVFATVDTYDDWKDETEAQSIAVATASPRPSAEDLMQRAAALQERHHFRYPPGDLVAGRVINEKADGGEVLTDDFAPVNLYETMPLPKKKSRAQ
jgi:spermidine synthase